MQTFSFDEGTTENSVLSQLKETLVTTAWWAGALTVNASVTALVGAAVGAACGYGYATWSEPCISEANSYSVEKCAWSSPHFSDGALYGAAATALIGVAGTTFGFFKSPSRENAKTTMKATALLVAYCFGAGCSD